MVVLLMVRGVGGTFAFPTSTIMLTNSATSLRTLGTLNGLATSVSAVGRAVGPALSGSLFTLGVKRGYIVVPFWALSLIASIAAVPTFWLVEGKGFGDDPDSDDVDALSASASSASSLNEQGEAGKADDNEDGYPSESEYGEPTNILSYTSTRTSQAFASDDELDLSADEARTRQHPRRGMPGSATRTRSHSHGRHTRSLRRRSSVPVGMGIGFRRLSSNLGSTGIGALGVGGASWGGT